VRITIDGKNIEVTDAIRSYIEKKLGRLIKYMDRIMEIHVVMHVDKTKAKETQHVVDVTVWSGGKVARATETAVDLYAAIDLVYEKLEKQLKKMREKEFQASRKEAQKRKERGYFIEVDEEYEEDEIVFQKLSGKPMYLDEAVDILKMSHHQFIVFRNAETGKINVVYKRHDGKVGVVEP